MNYDLIINEKIFKIQKTMNMEIKRSELYSIFTLIILTPNYISSNRALEGFLGELDITFKNYVFKSKTLILARTLKEINSADNEFIERLEDKLSDIYNIKPYKSKKNNKGSEEYLNDILKKYSRGKNNE